MKRKEREITDRAELDAILRTAQVCRLALSDGEQPYIVPVCFGYDGDSLYIHSAPEGKKIDIIRKNDRVCFECDVESEIVPGRSACDWTMKYRSVVGGGRASFLEGGTSKARALDIIMEHYARGPFEYRSGVLKRTLIIKVAIDSLTGKRSGD